MFLSARCIQPTLLDYSGLPAEGAPEAIDEKRVTATQWGPLCAPPRSPPKRHLLGAGVISGCYQLGGLIKADSTDMLSTPS